MFVSAFLLFACALWHWQRLEQENEQKIEMRKELEELRHIQDLKCRLPQHANVRSCNCCPYGYHIDLDFVRYCEALANAKPSEEELRRRSRRLSRKSMEFMLGLDSLFEQWDAEHRAQVLQELPAENEATYSTTPFSNQQAAARPRSSSVPRFTYGIASLNRSESPFGTASSTCSSMRGAESDVPYSMRNPQHRPANSPPETRAFLREALDDVCSDFERTLERTSMRRKKAVTNGTAGYSFASDRNNNYSKTNGYSCLDKRNGHAWDNNFDIFDSCVSGNKSPRASRFYSKPLPFQQKLSPAEQKYESYVQATVAANSKSPVEIIELVEKTALAIPSPAPPAAPATLAPPAPPPRKQTLTQSTTEEETISTETITTTSKQFTTNHEQPQMVTTQTVDSTDAQTLYNIRQQMALSLKRMKDLEEQVKNIPEMQNELVRLREEKQRLQQTLQRKEDELLRSRDITRFSSSPSPSNGSAKYASPVQFTPQRISPISLDSMGARLRTNSSSSEKQLRNTLKRDVGTMCGLHATRDIAVGSPVTLTRSIGTSPVQTLSLSEMLYTQLQLEQEIRTAISSYEEKRAVAQLKKLISVGTQMYIPKLELRVAQTQTSAEKPVQKHHIGILAKPSTRDNYVSCKPSLRSVASSDDRITDVLCVNCQTANSTQPTAALKQQSVKMVAQTEYSQTLNLANNEKLPPKRKTIGTQYAPLTVQNTGSQTSLQVLHTIGVQSVPEAKNKSTQSHIDRKHCQTDTRDLVRLATTQTSCEEVPPIAKPELAPKPVLPPANKPLMRHTASNTDACKTVENGMNTLPLENSICHSASTNTEHVHKRDIGCGEVIKPHISIACADNYCDSCKDAIKNLAKDFTTTTSVDMIGKENILLDKNLEAEKLREISKTPPPSTVTALATTPTPQMLQTRSNTDSRIPRPKHITSPSPVRKQIQRQNTFTIGLTTAAVDAKTEKRTTASTLKEKPPAIASFHQNAEEHSSSSETQQLITEQSGNSTTTTQIRQSNNAEQQTSKLPKKAVLVQKTQERLSPVADNNDVLIVKEEKRVSVSWSRDASPVPLQQQTTEETLAKSLENSLESEKSQVSAANASKGAIKKITTTSTKSSQMQVKQQSSETAKQTKAEKPPTKAYLQRLALEENKTNDREKHKPTREMLTALKIINESLLKKMLAKSISSNSLRSAKSVIQQEWFRISSTDEANAQEVEDYLDCFEEFSVPLLEYCVNMADANGNTAMHYAVSHGNFDVVSILLDSKVCNVNQLNHAGYTCVMLVSLAKLKSPAHRTVVERLFQMADVNIRAKKHCQTALMLAVSHGNLEMVQLLLAAGADINISDEDGSTALMCAAEHGRSDIVKYLLSQPECNSLKQDVDGSTAFKIAWQAGHRDVGLLIYVHEQMLRSKLPADDEQNTKEANTGSPAQRAQKFSKEQR